MRHFILAPPGRPVDFPAAPAMPVRALMRFRLREAQTRRLRSAIATVILLTIVGGGWFAEKRGVLVKLREGAISALRAKTTDKPKEIGKPSAGRLVYELHDGLSCTYVPFDNIEQWMGEPNTTICEPVARKLRRSTTTGFSWGR